VPVSADFFQFSQGDWPAFVLWLSRGHRKIITTLRIRFSAVESPLLYRILVHCDLSKLKDLQITGGDQGESNTWELMTFTRGQHSSSVVINIDEWRDNRREHFKWLLSLPEYSVAMPLPNKMVLPELERLDLNVSGTAARKLWSMFSQSQMPVLTSVCLRLSSDLDLTGSEQCMQNVRFLELRGWPPGGEGLSYGNASSQLEVLVFSDAGKGSRIGRLECPMLQELHTRIGAYGTGIFPVNPDDVHAETCTAIGHCGTCSNGWFGRLNWSFLQSGPRTWPVVNVSDSTIWKANGHGSTQAVKVPVGAEQWLMLTEDLRFDEWCEPVLVNLPSTCSVYGHR